MKKTSFQYGVSNHLDTQSHVGLLLEKLHEIFPEQTLTNVKKEGSLKYESTGYFMEMDVWIPKHKIGFEFQDSYHYVTTWYNHKPQFKIQRKDIEKRNSALQSGVTLVAVPCWWNGNRESLDATIAFQRPDICTSSEIDVIPLNPPEGYFSDPEIPDVKELMLASFPIEYKFKISRNTWWIGEKYDGVRFCWHPRNKQLYTRSGQILHIAPAFRASLPPIFMDGEIWFGRGNFGCAYALVRQAHDEFGNWHLLRLMSFDIPAHHTRNQPYEERYASLLVAVENGHPSTIIVPRMRCENIVHLDGMVKNVIEEEGEGLIVQRSDSPYESGRTSSLIKLKAVQADKEAIVVDVNQHGAELQLPNGTIFTVPPEDILTPSPPSTGDVVTFSYEGTWRRDIPVSPKIYRIRTDVSWQEVLVSFDREKKQLGDTSQMAGFTMEQKGIKKMRAILMDFARKRGLDPLRAKTWRTISKPSLHEEKDALSILQKFKMQYYQMLRTLFPELDLDINSWGDVRRRRLFFEKYAKLHGFDPLIPGNWYKEPRKKIASFKGAHRVAEYHNASISQALLDLFPNIGLEKSKFKPQYLWKDVKKRRKFFEKYAKDRGFDPNNPEKWYQQTKEEVVSTKGGTGVLAYYNGSMSKALVELFPTIGIDKTKFRKSSHWYNPNNRKQFFINFAQEKGFDPHVPGNWYMQQRESILSTKGASAVLMYHKDSIARALSELFPNTKFDTAKFKEPQIDCSSAQNRRIFFEDFAKENGFDPLYHENWYSQSREKILAKKGWKAVLSYHNNKVSQALYDLFPEVGFDTSRFQLKKLSWLDSRNRRMFFELYAADNKFDPLEPQNWYNQPFHEIMQAKSARAVMFHHKNSVMRALLENFPEIGLDKSKFTKKTWQHKT